MYSIAKKVHHLYVLCNTGNADDVITVIIQTTPPQYFEQVYASALNWQSIHVATTPSSTTKLNFNLI